MKKTYFAPDAKVVNVKAQNILSGSDYTPSNKKVNGNQALSERDFDFEEEEEY